MLALLLLERPRKPDPEDDMAMAAAAAPQPGAPYCVEGRWMPEEAGMECVRDALREAEILSQVVGGRSAGILGQGFDVGSRAFVNGASSSSLSLQGLGSCAKRLSRMGPGG